MRNVPASKIEKETVRLECKCKQMLEWKRKSAAMLASYDYALKVHTYIYILYIYISIRVTGGMTKKK